MNFLQKSAYSEAIRELKRALQPSKGKADIVKYYLAVVYAKAGRTGAAEKILRDFVEVTSSKKQFIPALAIAQIQGALGKRNEAIRLLEDAYERGDYGSLLDLKVSPMWDDVRSDPKFTTLVTRIGLG